MSNAPTQHLEPRRSSRLLSAAAVLLFVVALSAISWRLYEHRPSEVVSLDRWALASYRDVIYFPLVALGDGVNPYDSVRDGDPRRYMERYPVADHLPLYSPLALLVFAPLALLPVEASMIAFTALNTLMFLLLAWTTIRVIGRRPTVAGVFGLAAFLLVSQPGRGTFNAGQLSVPLALAIVGALEWGDRRRWRSAVLVAVSTLKPTFGGPFGVLLAARRDGRSALAGLAIGGCAFLVGMFAIFAWTGEVSIDRVTQVLSGNHAHLSQDPEAVPQTNKARTDLPAVYEYLTKQPVPGWVSLSVAAAILAITFAKLWRTRDARQVETAASPASALIVVAIFICIFHNVYDLPLLIVPLAACVSAADSSWKKIQPVRRCLIATLLLAPFLNIFWTQGFHSLLERSGISWGPSAGVVLDGAYRVACAANGLALFTVWGILIVSIPRGSKSAGSVVTQLHHPQENDRNRSSRTQEYPQPRQSLKHGPLGGNPLQEALALSSAPVDERQAVAPQRLIH